MVHYAVAQGQGQDHQGRLTTGPGPPHSHVQLSRIQRYRRRLLARWQRVRLLIGTTPTADTKVVYRRYASLFFIAATDPTDNELITLEIVHRYVEQMDKYYGNVCELDIIFNFQKAYFILDELLLAGEMQESSKKNVLRVIGAQDSLEDMEVSLAVGAARHTIRDIFFCSPDDNLYHHPLMPCPARSRTMLLQESAECICFIRLPRAQSSLTHKARGLADARFTNRPAPRWARTSSANSETQGFYSGRVPVQSTSFETWETASLSDAIEISGV